MSKIIVCGSFDIFPLYIRVDGGREIKICGKSDYPRSITISSGDHRLFATTLSKLDRAGGVSATAARLNTTIEADFTVDPSDVLLLRVRREGMKVNIDHVIVPVSKANDYVNMGNVIEYDEKDPGEKNKWIALLLCLFLGFFGAHKFYEGKIGIGILYLFTGGLFGIGVLVDFFKILFRKA